MVKKIAMMIMTTMHCNRDKCDGDFVIMTFDLGGPYHTTAKTKEYTIIFSKMKRKMFWKRRKQLINWRDRKLTCRKCLICRSFIEILAIVVFRSHANDVRCIRFQVLNLVAELTLSFWCLYVLCKYILRCKPPVLHNVAINSKGYSFFRRQPLNTKLVWFLIRDCYV